MADTTLTQKEKSDAREVFLDLRHRKTKSLNDNNLAKFHAMMREKSKTIDSQDLNTESNCEERDDKVSNVSTARRVTRNIKAITDRSFRIVTKTKNCSSQYKNTTETDSTCLSRFRTSLCQDSLQVPIINNSELLKMQTFTPVKAQDRRISARHNDIFTFRKSSIKNSENINITEAQSSLIEENEIMNQGILDNSIRKLSKSHKVGLQQELLLFNHNRANRKSVQAPNSSIIAHPCSPVEPSYGDISSSKAISLVRIPTRDVKKHSTMQKFIAFQMKQDILKCNKVKSAGSPAIPISYRSSAQYQVHSPGKGASS